MSRARASAGSALQPICSRARTPTTITSAAVPLTVADGIVTLAQFVYPSTACFTMSGPYTWPFTYNIRDSLAPSGTRRARELKPSWASWLPLGWNTSCMPAMPAALKAGEVTHAPFGHCSSSAL